MIELPSDLEECLKFIEVRKIYNLRNSSFSLERIADISHIFLCHYRKSNDIRFLNASLKINDRLREEKIDPSIMISLENEEKEALHELAKKIGVEL